MVRGKRREYVQESDLSGASRKIYRPKLECQKPLGILWESK